MAVCGVVCLCVNRKGCPPDAPQARRLYELAANAGELGGVCGMAYMRLSGLGGYTVDVHQAKVLYQRVIDAGDTRGNVGMGWLHLA